MSWFSSIFNGGEIVKDVLDGADNLFTSDEERLQWETKKLEIKAKIEAKLLEFEDQLNTHLDERQKLDMQSDSWLSKNIRPISLIHFVVVLDAIILLGYFGFTIPSAILTLVGTSVQLILGFYFGGRSLEKGIKMISGVLSKGKNK